MRRIGVMLNLGADDRETKARLAAFTRRLAGLGWREGKNVAFEYRWGMGDLDLHRQHAAELARLSPDVILAHGSFIVRPLLHATRKIPVVFVSVGDPVAGGFAGNLARPGGNATGFSSIEYALSGKWLELLKQIAPKTSRVAVLRDPEQVSGGGQLGALEAVARVLGVELFPIDVREPKAMKAAIAAFAQQPNGGLIATTTALAQIHRAAIVGLATQYRLPAVYPYRLYIPDGGLVSYGPDILLQYRLAADYVDRILRGANPGDLPIQQPNNYLLVVNLKAAKAIGLQIPETVLGSADEVIE